MGAGRRGDAGTRAAAASRGGTRPRLGAARADRLPPLRARRRRADAARRRLPVRRSGEPWLGRPGDRVVLGAVASLGVLLAGLVLRSRYGRLQASLAATGAGIAGAYATLAAATILYGLIPSWAALLLAAGIASVGGAIALAWSSQLLAGLALVGAAAAPGLVALDDGITAPAPAFALVVLVATIGAASRRRWLWLVAAVGTTALPQVVWLVADSPHEDWGAVAVSAAASLVLLAGAVVWQASAVDDGLDSSAATMALLGAGVAFGAARALLPDGHDEGVALAVMAAVYGAVAIASGRRWRDLGWVVGAAALLLAAVATADLLSGRSLSIVFAVQAVVLAALAWRLESPRFELSALAYLALGIGHVGVVELEGALELGDVPRSAAAALFSLAAAALAVALLLPARRGDTPSSGIGAALEPLWDGLVRLRAWVRAALAAGAIALAAAGSAGVLSGRLLTIVWAAGAAAGGSSRGVGSRPGSPSARWRTSRSGSHTSARWSSRGSTRPGTCPKRRLSRCSRSPQPPWSWGSCCRFGAPMRRRPEWRRRSRRSGAA